MKTQRVRRPEPLRRGRRTTPASPSRQGRRSATGAAPAPARQDLGEQMVQELLELAFHRASKVAVSGDTTLQRQRRMALRKIGRASGNLLRQLRLKGRPFEDEAALGPFRLALLAERWGPGGRERSLLRLRRAQERLIRFRSEEERRIPRMEEREEIARAVRRYYGRAASLLREISADLVRLREMERLLKDRPSLEGPASTVVIAGYPNVGKSSLIARLTRAQPKIAPYPFTTVAVAVGHAPLGPLRKAQLVDTPGMLDRDAEERNPVEREAFLAVREGGSIVVFLLDPSGSCGWPIEHQEALLDKLKRAFPARTFLEVENKADLWVRPAVPDPSPSSSGTPPTAPSLSHPPRLRISCLTGEGVEELQERVSELLKESSGGLPPLPPIRDEELPPDTDEDSGS